MSDEQWLEVESLDLEGQGVAHRADGKVVFIEGALPGERVQVRCRARKNQWEQGTLSALRRESSQRVAPRCPHFGLHAGAAAAARCSTCSRRRRWPPSSACSKTTCATWPRCVPERMLRPLQGPAWGYRYRARLSVRHVVKKGTVLVGFHERKSRYVADMTRVPGAAAARRRAVAALA